METGSPDDHGSGGVQPFHHRSVRSGRLDQERGSGGGDESLLVDQVLESHRDSGEGSRVLSGADCSVDGLGSGEGAIGIEPNKGVQVACRLGPLQGGGDRGYGCRRARPDGSGDSKSVSYSQVTVL